jgi:hypothetical protein
MTGPEAQVHSSAIRRADLFRGLAPDVVNELLPVWQVHRARTGTVFPPEDAATRFWIVLSGRVGMPTRERRSWPGWDATPP